MTTGFLFVIDTRHLGLTTPSTIDVNTLYESYRAESETVIETAEIVAEEGAGSVTSATEIGLPYPIILENAIDHDINPVVMEPMAEPALNTHCSGVTPNVWCNLLMY